MSEVHARVSAGRPAPLRRLRLEHAHGSTEAGHTIFCAGAWADRLAVAAGADPDPRIVPFRGAYLRLAPERRGLVRSLIYPVPDPALPFLGVHLTKRIDGEVLVGPTALLAGARDAYSIATVRRRDLIDTLAWPGTWRMLANWWRTGASELGHAALRSAFVHAARRYVPELRVVVAVGQQDRRRRDRAGGEPLQALLRRHERVEQHPRLLQPVGGDLRVNVRVHGRPVEQARDHLLHTRNTASGDCGSAAGSWLEAVETSRRGPGGECGGTLADEIPITNS